MANILVYMETHEGRIIPTSLRALEIGRMLASQLGATLYSILSVKEVTESNQDLLYQIAAYKTDRLIIASSPIIHGPPRVVTDGHVLSKITERYPPNVFLFGDSAAAVELASYVSSKIHAVFARDYHFDMGDEILVTLIDHLAESTTALDEDELEQPVVGIVRGEPQSIPHDFNELDIIAIKNEFSSFQRDFYTVRYPYQYGEGALMIAGEKASAHIPEIIKLSRLKEWTLLATRPLVSGCAHEGLPMFNSRATKAGRTKIILFGLSERELLDVVRFSSYDDKYVLVECDAPLPHGSLAQVAPNGSISEFITVLEESIY